MAYENEHMVVSDSTQWGTFTNRTLNEVSGQVKTYITRDGDNFLGIYMSQPNPADGSLLCGFTHMAQASHIPTEIGTMGNLGNGFPVYELTHEQEQEYLQSAQYLQFDRKHLKY